MATMLCHIEINPGKQEEFERVMKEVSAADIYQIDVQDRSQQHR